MKSDHARIPGISPAHLPLPTTKKPADCHIAVHLQFVEQLLSIICLVLYVAIYIQYQLISH